MMKLQKQNQLKKLSRKKNLVNSTNSLLRIQDQNNPKEKIETNNELQDPITKISNDEFEEKINF